MIPSRKMFYRLAKKENINLIILELKCSDRTAKKRIVKEAHQSHRMPGTSNTRWDIYLQIKKK